MKPVRSYLVNGLLASAVFYFAYDLSRSGRTAVDFVVMGLIGLAILWNVFRLGQRLYRSGGGKDLWHLQRTLLFWIIGLFNTLMIRSEEVASWRNLVGWAFLVVAAVDSIVLYRKEQSSIQPRTVTRSETGESHGDSRP